MKQCTLAALKNLSKFVLHIFTLVFAALPRSAISDATKGCVYSKRKE